MTRVASVASVYRRLCVIGMAGIGGVLLQSCTGGPEPIRPLPSRPEAISLEQRLETLAATTGPITPAAMPPEEAQTQLAKLEAEKARLLARLTEAHPNVVLLERQIKKLRERIAESTAQTAAAAK